jgi:heme exporter protein B
VNSQRSAPRNRVVLAALLRKELRIELRSFQAVPAMSLFSVTTFVLFHFGLQSQGQGLSGDLASGVLWVTLLFAAVLGINRLFVADAQQGGFDGFLLSPADRSALLVSKALTLLAYLLVLEVVAVPAFALLLLGPAIWPAMGGLLLVLALGDLGIVVIGTLVGALAVRTSARDLLGPMLSLPLLVPVLLCAARATSPLLAQAGVGALSLRWLLTLALYDLVFGLITFAVFDFLLED